MNKHFSLLLAVACTSSLNAMETDSNNNNENSIQFLSPEQLLTAAEQEGLVLKRDKDHF